MVKARLGACLSKHEAAVKIGRRADLWPEGYTRAKTEDLEKKFYFAFAAKRGIHAGGYT